MHELISSVAIFFLSPLNWIVILIILYFIVRSAKAKKMYILAAIILFILFSNQWLLNAYAHFWNPPPRDVTVDKPYSCAIVLGGFGSPDENGDGYFNISSDRFIQAVKLFKMGKIQHIMISGGNGKDTDENFREGAWAKQQMEIMGIPDTVIFYEDRSDNTVGNAINTKHVLDSASLLPPYLLITSASHLPRAALIFKNVGVPVIGYPCNYTEDWKKFSFHGIIPKPENLFAWHVYLKEIVGYFYYYLKGKQINN